MATIESPFQAETLIEISVTPDALCVAGEIDAANCAVLREAIAAAESEFSGPIPLDMSGVEFMDSSGIGVLIAAYKARVEGVVLLRASEPVTRVLQLTGLYDRFVGGHSA